MFPVMAKVSVVVFLGSSQIETILGMVRYYHDFCVNFSTVVSPIADLLCSREMFEWIEACRQAFEKVKCHLLSAPVLAAPDHNEPFSLASCCNVVLTVLIIQTRTSQESLTAVKINNGQKRNFGVSIGHTAFRSVLGWVFFPNTGLH